MKADVAIIVPVAPDGTVFMLNNQFSSTGEALVPRKGWVERRAFCERHAKKRGDSDREDCDTNCIRLDETQL